MIEFLKTSIGAIMMVKENILKEVITGYRNTVSQRYQYENLKDKYELPNSINEKTVNQIRDYF